jgi:AcrR family transcriptional regulator
VAHTIDAMATIEARARDLRADAQRNRDRIIAAAVEVFAERGLEASTAEIAQRAGVGEATLFRRFPSKDDLIIAIVETQMGAAVAVAKDCLADDDAGAGLERFVTWMVERSVADRGVMDAAKDSCMMRDELEPMRRNMLTAMSALVKRAQEAGAVRDDLTGQDLGILAHSVAASAELPFPGVRKDIWKRYLGLILDGMRPDGATKLRPGAPSKRAFETPADCG